MEKIKKVIKIVVINILVILLTIYLFSYNKVFAEEETTKFLYQDITINKDGSITVKEATWLNGEYNGRFRDIDFRNTWATEFTGIFSDFTGNSDIYNGSELINEKVYDISQNNFKSIDDIEKEEKVYEEVKSAKNGKYGVYTLEKNSSSTNFKIYCPDKQKKVICLEYTIKDAVVVHNDVAELYWNLLGSYFEESIEDFQVKVHLPGEDNDVRIWTHGPLTGENKILDNKTLYFKDTNVEAYTDETIRIMFNKDLVPLATKTSGIDGRDNILKYEEMMANSANFERDKRKLENESRAGEAVSSLEDDPRMYKYNYALELVNELDDSSEQKQNFLERIEKTRTLVNADWKESVETSIEILSNEEGLYRFLDENSLENLKEKIEEGFDEEAKENYFEDYKDLQGKLEEKRAIQRIIFRNIVIFTNVIIGIFAIYKLIKIMAEKNTFKEKYYRDFPNEDNPNVLEYLMYRNSTNLGFSATILNLINKKIISYEKDKKNSITLVLINNEYVGTSAEAVVLNVLFKLIGKNDKCKLNSLRNYGKSYTSAKKLVKKMDEFKKVTKEETNYKDYFKSDSTLIIYKIFVIINYVLSMSLAFGVFLGLKNCAMQVIIYLLGITLLNAIYFIIGNKDKNRTNAGKEEYSKWLAHKRFLEDFSNFDEKDLPEITLWEKYLVTATVLGVADKVEKRMKMEITNTNNIDTNLIIYNTIEFNITTQLNNSIKTTINNSNNHYYTSSGGGGSSYSSGGGFGGGSSGGGGRWRPEAAVVVVSKLNKKYREF